MSKVCSNCGKKARSGNKRSHSNIATKRKFGANIHSRKFDGKRINICTRCIKAKSKVS